MIERAMMSSAMRGSVFGILADLLEELQDEQPELTVAEAIEWLRTRQ